MRKHIPLIERGSMKEYPDLRKMVAQSMRKEDETGQMPYVDHGLAPSVKELLSSHEHRAVNYGFNPDELEERIARLKKLNEQGDCV